ncbi:MAG: DUF559 domain-containing protein [Actinomycetota bacterium]|nr:DUF559 domain-containing protein [Actinomycetota bacterium]
MENRRKVEQRLRHWLGGHHCVITRAEALRLGATDPVIRSKLDRGEWSRLTNGVYRDTAAPRTPHQLLRAACVGAGSAAVASHRSAAWLWGLLDQAPTRHEVTLGKAFQPRRRGQGAVVHRMADLDLSRTVTLTGIPVTDPLRTLVDLGASVASDNLLAAVVAALAKRLVTVDGLVAELNRLQRPGRQGPGALRRLLTERGFVGVPHPSVLEARMAELFAGSRLPAPERELLVGDNGEYRLDFALRAVKFAIEVDGYAWHWSPEHLQRDLARRNDLQRAGWVVLVYTWRDVMAEPRRVRDEIAACYQQLARPAANQTSQTS